MPVTALSSTEAAAKTAVRIYRLAHAKFGREAELATAQSGASNGSEQLLRTGLSDFNSDGTPKASRVSSYSAPGSNLIQRNTDSPRASLLPVQPMEVEGSGGSLLSPGSSKKVSWHEMGA